MVIEPLLRSLLESLGHTFILEAQGMVSAFILYLPRFVLAAFLLWAGWRASKIAVKRSGPIVARTIRRPALIRQTLKLIQYLVFFLFLMAVLDILMLLKYFTPVLAGAAVLSVVVGFAVAPLVSSYLSGFFVLSDRPYEIGDRVEVLGTDPPIKGYIEDVAMRFTRIRTLDNNILTVPNSSMLEKVLINYTTQDKRTRVDLPMGISYKSDLDKAIEIMVGAAKETEDVLRRGEKNIGGVEYGMAPKVLVEGYGSSSIELLLRVWVKDPFHLKSLKSRLYLRIFEEFKKNNIVIPYPHRDVVIREGRLEKKE
ncbi:MAG: mechanosensitive ion channel family protein [Candidatus Hydrothermarchaeales archaeon]